LNKHLFRQSLFLAITILTSAAALLRILDFSPSLFGILFSIALWIIYISSKKDAGDIEGLAFLCGVVKALYIVVWVLVVLAAVIALLLMFVPQSMYSVFMQYGSFYPYYSDFYTILPATGNTFFIWIGAAILILSAAAGVVNCLFVKKLYAMVRSLRSCIEGKSYSLVQAEPVRKWLLVLGILLACAFWALSSGRIDAVATVCSSVAMILSSVWIGNLSESSFDSDPYGKRSEWYS